MAESFEMFCAAFFAAYFSRYSSRFSAFFLRGCQIEAFAMAIFATPVR